MNASVINMLVVIGRVGFGIHVIDFGTGPVRDGVFIITDALRIPCQRARVNIFLELSK